MSSRLTIDRSAVKDRRGFGLFSDDEDDSDIERTPVSFSGNKSGFQALSPGDAGNSSPAASTSCMISPLASSTPTRGSRNSALITPLRPRSAHRSTPYSTTTSRALMRAKISKDATIDRESELISTETTYETTASASVKRSKYTMSGARESPREDAEPESDGREEQEEAEDKKREQEFSITPSRNIFSRTTTPSKTPTKSPKRESQVPETGKKTWGQWLGAILPASVKKPVKAILGDPAELRSTKQEVQTPKETPTQDYDFEDNEGLSLPGSFGKAPPSPVRTPSQPPSRREQRKVEICYETPSREGLFAYQKPKVAVAPRTLPPPSRRIIPTLAPSSKTPGRSASPTTTQSSSFHRPSNFIERMKSAKRTNRYDPYSRPKGTTSRRKKRSPELSEPMELTAEEELELLKRREKERKVQEAEDRYLKREIRKKLGQEDPEQDGDGDSEMSDTDTSSLQPSMEEVPDEGDPPERAPSPLPPKSPVKQSVPSPSTTPIRPVPTFLFGNSSPSSTTTTTTTTTPVAPEPVTAPTWSFSSDSDKENISSGPPPPPTMSHAQLPAPLTTSSHPPAIAGGLLGTSPQPAGGFGLGLPKESTPLNRQRSAAEKFKPHVSSGLRESSTVDEEKENENDMENKKPSLGYDKENAPSSSSGKLGGPSSGGIGGGPALQSVFKPSGALKENSGVLNLGKSDVKVDLRAKIEAVCPLPPYLLFVFGAEG
ncbi:hypothetical protein HOY82DRAFT_317323 [Tuber indicum]|nr:hypothetical protein HOY82DRAFT_317323 [Tuber indicum]